MLTSIVLSNIGESQIQYRTFQKRVLVSNFVTLKDLCSERTFKKVNVVKEKNLLKSRLNSLSETVKDRIQTLTVPFGRKQFSLKK